MPVIEGTYPTEKEFEASGAIIPITRQRLCQMIRKYDDVFSAFLGLSYGTMSLNKRGTPVFDPYSHMHPERFIRTGKRFLLKNDNDDGFNEYVLI